MLAKTMIIVGILSGGRYMEQDFQTHKDKLRQQIEEQYGKLLYSYVTHICNASFLQKDAYYVGNIADDYMGNEIIKACETVGIDYSFSNIYWWIYSNRN